MITAGWKITTLQTEFYGRIHGALSKIIWIESVPCWPRKLGVGLTNEINEWWKKSLLTQVFNQPNALSCPFNHIQRKNFWACVIFSCCLSQILFYYSWGY